MPTGELHKRLLDNLSSAVLLLDGDLKVLYMNPAAEAMLAVSHLRVLGEPLSLVMTESAEALEAMKKALATGVPYTRRKTQLLLNDPTDITVDYTITPLIDKSLNALLMEIHSLDRLLRISREEARMASQRTNRALIRGLAHEIKNPLGGIRGAAQLLAKELPDNQLDDYTNVIIEEADRLRNLVDRMLGPRNLPNYQPTNIHEITERTCALIHAECSGKIELVRDYDPSIPDLEADREQLIQAVLNIVRNAMEALLELDGSEQGRIILKTRTLRQFTIGGRHHRLVCRIDIIDNGPGIPPEILENIFMPMISGKANGSGLGLSISQSIINQHQGLIECDSRPGETQFTLLLPLEQVYEQQAE